MSIRKKVKLDDIEMFGMEGIEIWVFLPEAPPKLPNHKDRKAVIEYIDRFSDRYDGGLRWYGETNADNWSLWVDGIEGLTDEEKTRLRDFQFDFVDFYNSCGDPEWGDWQPEVSSDIPSRKRTPKLINISDRYSNKYTTELLKAGIPDYEEGWNANRVAERNNHDDKFRKARERLLNEAYQNVINAVANVSAGLDKRFLKTLIGDAFNRAQGAYRNPLSNFIFSRLEFLERFPKDSSMRVVDITALQTALEKAVWEEQAKYLVALAPHSKGFDWHYTFTAAQLDEYAWHLHHCELWVYLQECDAVNEFYYQVLQQVAEWRSDATA